MKRLLIILISLVSVSFLSSASFAEGELSEEELSITERASKRMYPGGADESNLKVLSGVAEASPKVTRNQIEKDVYQRLFQEQSQKNSDDDQ